VTASAGGGRRRPAPPHSARRGGIALVAVVCAAVGMAGCATGTARTDAPGTADPFPADVVFDYQLGGGYEPAPGVGGVVRDSTDVPHPDLYSVCYVNGFQSQPADRESWLAEPDLVLTDDEGAPIIDENWPDELILDISTPQRRDRVAARIGESIAACAAGGFRAVEIDNLDAYTRSRGRIDVEDALDLAARYAGQAHGAGLLIGQKNAAELGPRGREDAGFDFAVAEECASFDECDAYRDVYADAVIDIEYADDSGLDFAAVCDDASAPYSTILRDRDLTPAGDPAHVFAACGTDGR